MRALHRPIDHVHVCSDEKTCCADDFNDDSDAKYTDGGEHGTEVTQLVLFLEDEAKADRMQRLITHHVRQSAHKCDKYKTSVAERRKEGKSRLFFIEREEDVDRENREMGIMRGKRSRNEGKEKERRLNEFAKRLQLTHLMPSVFEPKKLIENTGVGKSMVEGSRPRVGLSEQYQQVMEQVTAARLISSPASSTESRMSTPDAEHVPSVLSILGVDSLSSLSSTSSSPLSPQSSASASIMPPSLLGVLTAFPTVADSNTGAKNVTVSDADADINTDKAYGEMMEKICTDAGLDLGGFTVQAGAGVGCVERPSDTGCGSTPMDAERDDQGVDDSRRNCMPSVLSSSVFSSSSYVSPLVMDTGSFSMKLGFAQDEHVDEQNHSSLSSVSTISSPPTVFPVPPLPSVVEANQLYYPRYISICVGVIYSSLYQCGHAGVYVFASMHVVLTFSIIITYTYIHQQCT